MSIRVSLLGYGAIGRPVADALAAGTVAGVELAGIVTRTPGVAASRGHAELSMVGALDASDLVVECAGIEAVRAYGPTIIASGTDLLIASVGALADEGLRHTLLHGGPGRGYLTAGAIGGLDLLGAVARNGGLDAVMLTTTKTARTLLRPWMDAEAADALRHATEAVTVFDGEVLEAIALFPQSLNVAVALAAATGNWSTRVRLIGDPYATLTTHQIDASGMAGDYSFTISNHPLESNPRSSSAVPAAILHGLAGLARPSGTFL